MVSYRLECQGEVLTQKGRGQEGRRELKRGVRGTKSEGYAKREGPELRPLSLVIDAWRKEGGQG